MDKNYDKDKKGGALDVVKSVKSRLKPYRENFEKFWEDEEDAYHGKIWKNSDGFRPYENGIFQIIEGEVPIMTDGMPATVVKVKDDTKLDQATILNKGIEWVYKNQSFDLKYPMIVRDSLVSAPAFIHTYYDANANNGNGEIMHEIVNWRGVYLHGSSLFVENSDEARIELPRSKNWLMLNYKKYADDIKKLKGEEFQANDKDGREKQDTGRLGYAKRQKPPIYKDENQLTLVKTFIRDYSMVSIPMEETKKEFEAQIQALENGQPPEVSVYQDHAEHIKLLTLKKGEVFGMVGLTLNQGDDAFFEAISQMGEQDPESGVEEIILMVKMANNLIEEHKILSEENPKGQRLKYKNGLRCIETVQTIVLYDGPSRDDHCDIPLVPFYCYRDGTPYGFGEVRNIIDSERMKAVMTFKEYKGLQKVANPNIIYDIETGLTDDDISNEDGGIYGIPQGTNIRHMAGGQVSTQLGTFCDDRKRATSDISGINEATQGKIPSPTASGVTVERTQTQAIGRIRLKDRQNQYYSIARLGKLTASLIIQYWTSDRVIDIDNQNGDYESFLFNPLEMEDLEYNVEIDQGSMAGIDKDAYNAQLFNMLQMQHITFDEYLQMAEMPRTNKLLEMVKVRTDKDAQIQELNNQLIMLKGQTNPESLTPEEQEIFQQLLLEQQQAVTQDQA